MSIQQKLPSRVIILSDGDKELYLDTYWHVPSEILSKAVYVTATPAAFLKNFKQLDVKAILDHADIDQYKRIEYRDVVTLETSVFACTMLERHLTTYAELLRYVLGLSPWRPTIPWPDEVIQVDQVLNGGSKYATALAQNAVNWSSLPKE